MTERERVRRDNELHMLGTFLQRMAAVESANNFKSVSCFSDEMR